MEGFSRYRSKSPEPRGRLTTLNPKVPSTYSTVTTMVNGFLTNGDEDALDKPVLSYLDYLGLRGRAWVTLLMESVQVAVMSSNRVFLNQLRAAFEETTNNKAVIKEEDPDGDHATIKMTILLSSDAIANIEGWNEIRQMKTRLKTWIGLGCFVIFIIVLVLFVFVRKDTAELPAPNLS